ncbi:Cu/Zn superoxide dismutase [Melampsora larici-populina 98AG31]|uniref:Cu/Zn superoxide dismutase n=1 Tax=Melampsora larici-populina (strain 98AG31 / pathotype 3-4-7) TaxID=747676 RepID=F4RQD3_MELLP|nr:Cu/Zn superoxide dismutase [Melampsora larici-populina 98AG31]EGG05387.1 Cu/Zn superoxide dismutase [Melampsora larici-populina 98AG31]
MICYSFVSFLFILASFDLTQADMRLSRRSGVQQGSADACTPRNMYCQREAIAYVDGEFGVKGYVKFIAPYKSDEVKVILSITGLDKYSGTTGPFPYHVHVNPIQGKNCETALGHLNPYKLPEIVACDPVDVNTCEVGDLSGKHGKLTAARPYRSYIDSQLKFTPEEISFVGRSVVIHDANKKRIACGTIVFHSTN